MLQRLLGPNDGLFRRFDLGPSGEVLHRAMGDSATMFESRVLMPSADALADDAQVQQPVLGVEEAVEDIGAHASLPSRLRMSQLEEPGTR